MTRKLLFITMLIIISFSVNHCVINFKETVFGNGNVITEDRLASPFNKLEISGGINAIITQGDTESIEVVADENLMEYIRTEITDHTLSIYSDVIILHAKSKEVHLVFKQLNEIDISSAGDVNGTNRLKTDQLDIDLSSAGDLTLEVEASVINCDISSAGVARLSGNTDELDADLSSAGDLNAYDLVARIAHVNSTSAGNARICATEEVDLHASSAGNIYYKGDPEKINVHRSSAGNINKK